MFFRQRTVFISHSSENSEIAHQLSGLLKKIGIPSEGIFCSSILGQGVNNGEKLNDRIFNSISRADIIIFLISDAFIKSSYCMEELGIGWYFAFNNCKICFYIKIPDIELNELSGFVNAKIDKFSLVDSVNDTTLFVENICDIMRIKTRRASEISNDVNAFIGAIRECCLKFIAKKAESKSNTIQIIEDELYDKSDKLELELINIESLFSSLALGTVVKKEAIIELRFFIFNMIDRYEELHSLLKREPSNKSMQKLISQAYLACQEYDKALKHFINALKMDTVYIQDVNYFVEGYPYSLKDAIRIVKEKLEISRVRDRDCIRYALRYLEDEESKRQSNGSSPSQ